MKAFVYEKYGSIDELKLVDIENPIPKDDEVLVKIHSVSLNDFDLGLLYGKPFILRLSCGLFKPKFKILGSDIAGIVASVGKNVKKFKPGDAVYGDLSECGWGGFAEFVCAKENALVIKPSNMTFDEAAAIPQAGVLTTQGLIDEGRIKKGITVLINGAGGGVGTFGVQIAKLFEVKEISGIDNSKKLNMMKSLGFDSVSDYTKEDFTKSGKSYDLILDAKTNRSIFKYLNVLNPNGIYVTVGGHFNRLLQCLFLSPILSSIYKKHFKLVILKPNKDLEYINEIFESGKIKPIINDVYKFNDLKKALKLFEEGNHKGKVIIKIC